MLALEFDPICPYFVWFLRVYKSAQSALVANSQVVNMCVSVWVYLFYEQ